MRRENLASSAESLRNFIPMHSITNRGPTATHAQLSQICCSWADTDRDLFSRPKLSRKDAQRKSSADLQAAEASRRISECVDQRQTGITTISITRFNQGSYGSHLGVSDIQHSTVDEATVETNACGGLYLSCRQVQPVKLVRQMRRLKPLRDASAAAQRGHSL